MLRHRSLWRWPDISLLLVLAGLQLPLAQAQARPSSAAFSVLITLANPGILTLAVVNPAALAPSPPRPGAGGLPANVYARSLCVGATVEAPTEATVRVVCSSGEYVAIAPKPKAPYLGALGEVYHTRFGPGAGELPAWAARLHPGLLVGSGATYQVQRMPDWDDPLQLVVSF